MDLIHSRAIFLQHQVQGAKLNFALFVPSRLKVAQTLGILQFVTVIVI